MTWNGYYENNESGFGHYKMKKTLNKLELGYELTPTVTTVVLQQNFRLAFYITATYTVRAKLRQPCLYSRASATIKGHRINPYPAHITTTRTNMNDRRENRLK